MILPHCIDSKEATDIAYRFLSQHHSVRGVEGAVFEDEMWNVIVLVTSPKMRKMLVKVDARTGRILGWDQSVLYSTNNE